MKEVYQSPTTYDASFPSEKEYLAAAKQHRQLQASTSWVPGLQTYTDLAAHSQLGKIYSGERDKGIKEAVAIFKQALPSQDTLLSSDGLAEIRIEMKAATKKDADDKKTGADKAKETEAPKADESESEKESGEEEPSEKEQKRKLKAKAAMLRSSKVSFVLVDGNANRAEVSAKLGSALACKSLLSKATLVRVFDQDCAPEVLTRPWEKSPPFLGFSKSRVGACIDDLRDQEVALLTAGTSETNAEHVKKILNAKDAKDG